MTSGWAEGLHIGISGLIGAGKTTLCEALGKELNLPCYYEEVIDNEYLDDFYKDQKKFSFPLQIYFLNQRFKQQQQIIWSNKGGIQDRTIYEDSIFAKMLYNSGKMDERDYRTYISLFQNMSNFMKKPNIIIYLEVSPEESLKRIKKRNRGMESGMLIDYLRDLKVGYDEFLLDISKTIPVIKVDWAEFKTDKEIVEKIKNIISNLSNIHSISFK